MSKELITGSIYFTILAHSLYEQLSSFPFLVLSLFSWLLFFFYPFLLLSRSFFSLSLFLCLSFSVSLSLSLCLSLSVSLSLCLSLSVSHNFHAFLFSNRVFLSLSSKTLYIFYWKETHLCIILERLFPLKCIQGSYLKNTPITTKRSNGHRRTSSRTLETRWNTRFRDDDRHDDSSSQPPRTSLSTSPSLQFFPLQLSYLGERARAIFGERHSDRGEDENRDVDCRKLQRELRRWKFCRSSAPGWNSQWRRRVTNNDEGGGKAVRIDDALPPFCRWIVWYTFLGRVKVIKMVYPDRWRNFQRRLPA